MPLTRIAGRWCLTEDRKRVVPEGHEDARWLHWIDDDEVDEGEARRLGAETKSRESLLNKMRQRRPNK